MSQENYWQRLEANWLSKKSMYIIHNYNKADCSFLVKDANNKNSPKILNSFVWILDEVSPYFRKIFAENSNRKEIPIDDPYFEDILFYAHSDILPNLSGQPFEQFERLLEMRERAKIYEISGLNEAIMNELILMNQKGKKLEILELADPIKSVSGNTGYEIELLQNTKQGIGVEYEFLDEYISPIVY